MSATYTKSLSKSMSSSTLSSTSLPSPTISTSKSSSSMIGHHQIPIHYHPCNSYNSFIGRRMLLLLMIIIIMDSSSANFVATAEAEAALVVDKDNDNNKHNRYDFVDSMPVGSMPVKTTTTTNYVANDNDINDNDYDNHNKNDDIGWWKKQQQQQQQTHHHRGGHYPYFTTDNNNHHRHGGHSTMTLATTTLPPPSKPHSLTTITTISSLHLLSSSLPPSLHPKPPPAPLPPPSFRMTESMARKHHPPLAPRPSHSPPHEIGRSLQQQDGPLANNNDNDCVSPIGDILRSGAQNYGDYFGQHVSISQNGQIVAVGAQYYDGVVGPGSWTGLVQVYENINVDNNNGQWIQRGKNIEGQKEDDRLFANALSNDGNILAVGAYWNSDNGTSSGHVRVYQFNVVVGDWQQLGDTLVGFRSWDRFGWSVALSGDGAILAVGAYGGGGFSEGQVRVFSWNGSTTWINQGDPINGQNSGDDFGDSIALSEDGNILAVSATANDANDKNDSGSVQVFEFTNNNNWNPLGQELYGENVDDRYGNSVSLSSDGHTMAVGARYAHSNGLSDSGQVGVYHFNESDGQWTQHGSTLTGNIRNDYFGNSVSLSGDGLILAVGAPQDFRRKGFLRMFQWNDGDKDWQPFGNELVGTTADDDLGDAVAVARDGSTVVVGGDASGGTGRPGLAMVVQLIVNATCPPTMSPTMSPTVGPTTPRPTTMSPTLAPTSSTPSLGPMTMGGTTTRPTARRPTTGTEVVATVTGITMNFVGVEVLTGREILDFESVTKIWYEAYYDSLESNSLDSVQVLDLTASITVTNQIVNAVEKINTIQYDQTLGYISLDSTSSAQDHVLRPFLDAQAKADYTAQLQTIDAFQDVKTPIPNPGISDEVDLQDPMDNRTSFPMGVLIGVIVGALAFIAVCSIVAWLVQGYRKRHQDEANNDVNHHSNNDNLLLPTRPPPGEPGTVIAHLVNIEHGVNVEELPSNIPLVKIPTPPEPAPAQGGRLTEDAVVPEAEVDSSFDTGPQFKDQTRDATPPRAQRVPLDP